MKILVAEDDPVSRRILLATLTKWGHDVIVCGDGTEAWKELQKEDAPRLVILDWIMPGLDGIEICRKIRQMNQEPYSFILLLTAKNQKEDFVIGMEAGADDYIIKPFDVSELQLRLRAGERIVNLQSELIAAREALREQATHDPLTGTWNHAMILDILKRELSRARRQKEPLSIIMADIDNFKQINDNYGHIAGDKVLKDATKRLRITMRPYDEIGRYGGDEFLLVLPGCDESNVMGISERLRKSIREKRIEIDSIAIQITISLGALTYAQADEIKINSLIQAADIALYQAKNDGRDRFVLGSLKKEMEKR